ncbi:hypothetical protein HK104_001329 [Borealophlyctis nickersoniae]|nr:hypothetical protein HK104_001329 [Borealophlyctis nickersoniae]
MDLNEFRKRGHEAVERIAKYYEELEKYKVLSSVDPGYLGKSLPQEAPEEPESFDTIARDFEEKIMPGVTHWYAFEKACDFEIRKFDNLNCSFPWSQLCVDVPNMFTDVTSEVRFNWQTSPSCTELETVVLDWVAKLLHLDPGFLSQGKGGGVIQGSASEAIAVVVIAARERVLRLVRNSGADDEEIGKVSSRLIAYSSTQTHSATKKACIIANVRHRVLPVDEHFRLRGHDVAAAIKEDVESGYIPFFITATIGTTNSGAVDAISEIADALTAEIPIWLHVDAAWAGSALICEEYRVYSKGVERADSFNFNMHKWMLTNFDCSPLWVKNRSELTEAFSVSPAYLRNANSDSGLVTDYRDWQLPLGRRFRSLKSWFVLRTYGATGIRAHIRKHVHLARLFESHIQSRPDLFKVMTPLSFAILTFQILPSSESKLTANDSTRLVCDRINDSGRLMLTHTVLGENRVIRFVPGSPWTEERHINDAFQIIKEVATDVA